MREDSRRPDERGLAMRRGEGDEMVNSLGESKAKPKVQLEMSGASLRVGFASQKRRCAVDLQCWNPLFGGVLGGARWFAGGEGNGGVRSCVSRFRFVLEKKRSC